MSIRDLLKSGLCGLMRDYVVLATVFAAICPYFAEAGEPELISIDASGNPVDAFFAVGWENRLSADGRVATFKDAQGVHFARIRTPTLGATVPIATDYLSGLPVDGTFQISLSAQGRYVAFTSTHCNLTPTYQCSSNPSYPDIANIYRTDLEQGVTEIVSATINDESGTAAGDTRDHSRHPLISSDGRWVAFDSFSTVLADVPSNPGCQDVYLRDMNPGGFTRLISRYGNGDTFCGVPGENAGHSVLADMTPDGRHLVFVSNAPQLTGNESGAWFLFIYTSPDATHPNGQLESTGIDVPNFFANPEFGRFPSISDDGNVVAFYSAGLFSPFAGISTYNRSANKLTYAIDLDVNGVHGLEGRFPLISGDGTAVAYLSEGNDVVVWQPSPCPEDFCISRPEEFELISETTMGLNAGMSSLAPEAGGLDLTSNVEYSWQIGGALTASNNRPGTMISYDARYVAFNSTSSSLVANDTNGVTDVFVRDRSAGETRIASVLLLGDHVPGRGAWNGEVDASGTLAYFHTINPDPDFPPPPYVIHTLLHNIQSPDGAIDELKELVVNLNLQQGISNSLDGKLAAVERALSDVRSNNDVAAVRSLEAFINEVEAQRGTNLSEEQANQLVALARSIIDLI